MKKILIPALSLVLLLAACAGQESAGSTPSEMPGVSPTATSEATPAPSAEPTPSPEWEPDPHAEPPILDWMADQPVPDFLNAEQQNLFLRAFSAANFLMGCNTSMVDDYPLADGSQPDRNNYETVTLDNGWTYTLSVGRFARWDDFEAMLDSIFTPEYKEELLVSEMSDGTSIPLFTSTEDGQLCYLDASRGSNLEYDSAGIPDTYELVSQSDDAVEFHLIGHYADLTAEADEDGARPIYTESFPIRMERTDDGWRVAEFHLPY